MGVRNVTAVLGIAAAGFVIDAYGRRACGVPGLLLLAVGIFGTAAAPSVASLWAIHALLGLADGLVTTCVQTLESDLAPPESRTLTLTLTLTPILTLTLALAPTLTLTLTLTLTR